MIDRLSSDETLVEALKDGDPNAFKLLFDRYWQNLYTIVFSISRDREVASEIVHDIYLNLWLRRSKIQIEFFKGYVTASARYHVYRHMKKVKQNSAEYMDNLDPGNSITANEGELNIRYHEMEEKIERHLEDLPKRCKEIFTLSRMDQLSNDEIAERLDISKRTVENQLTYALYHLRISLKNLFVFLVSSGINYYF
ncbi:RNA polymerase sigma factor [Daejeonella sp.]|uniref:RNA polymerase sigma factor n=1 Tax=Daejeonella sp. TaxID=2805397 RepID=UPI0039830610